VIPIFLLLALGSAPDPQPYRLGKAATVEGAKSTVTRLLEVTRAGDDAGYDKIARGMVIMFAPDAGAPATRADFAQLLKICTGQRVVSSRPFQDLPKAQAVRIAMQCHDGAHPQPKAMVADIIADDEHALMFFFGGVSRLWPPSKP
jgi:hypothetical protein